MNTISKTIVLLLTLSFISPTIVLAKGGRGSGPKNRQTVVTLLDAEQETTLLWMREEEKLARDVYLAMSVSWGQPVFSNIASSEQRHMDALLKKINTFGLSDPAYPETGEFSIEELQHLYNELVDKGNQSYIDALEVGATIEDLDIYDLTEAIKETENIALKTTYENLLEGSKNHLRAFIGLLQEQGKEYKPQYISQELFDAILGV